MPNQKELARLAGVSAGSVSNVITGSKPVSDRVRKKVEAAIRQLDYRPNLIARSLKTNRTNILGFVIPEITVPFFPKLIRGATFAARERGYFLIVLDSDCDEALERELIALLYSQRVDGILLASAAGKWRNGEESSSSRSQCPIVCIDRLPEGLDADSVRVNGRAAAEMGVTQLLSMGHKQIAIITGPLNLKHERERLSGYKKALKKAGVEVRDSLIWANTIDRAEIDTVCKNGLLRAGERPSALFTTNGTIALEALHSIYAAGLSTPDDIAFVTLDEIAAADFFQPAITTIVQPTFEMGYRAVQVLLERIAQGDAMGDYKEILFGSTLVVRASSSLAFRPGPKGKQ